MTPFVSVIVAAYRPGRYLQDALDSALAQTFGDFEVIVADDGDDPAVREVVDSFGDSRLTYHGNKTRLGPARNHWTAFAAARGKYLSILNQDDRWRPEFLERMMAPLERDPGIVLAFCDHDVIDAGGATLTQATEQSSELWGRKSLAPGVHRPFHPLVARQSIPIAMGSVFRRDAIDVGALPDVGPAYDLWLAYELARGGGASWFVPERLSAWRQHPSQLTKTRNRRWAAGAVACWKAMACDPGFAQSMDAIAAKLSAAAVEESRSALSDSDWSSARHSAALALSSRPANWRAWWVFGLAHLPRRASTSTARSG